MCYSQYSVGLYFIMPRSKDQYFITYGIKRQQFGPCQAPFNPIFSPNLRRAAVEKGDPVPLAPPRHLSIATFAPHLQNIMMIEYGFRAVFRSYTCFIKLLFV